MRRSAIISEDGLYRYTLTRRWGTGRAVMFIMLNPSTADARQDDPTIRRCISFAMRWGYSALRVGNLFALRATDPRELRDSDDPVGPENDAYLKRLVSASDLIVAAWGASPYAAPRPFEVMANLPRGVKCLGTTKHGHPRHPLYVVREQKPRRFMP